MNKEEAKQITKATVDYLGSCGNGITFDEEDFNSKYYAVDMMGQEKNEVTAIQILVTSLLATGKK